MKPLTNKRLKPVLAFAFWTLVGLSFAGQFFISSSQLGRPVPWQTALIHSLSDWYVFAVLSVLPIAFTARFSLGDPFRAGHLVIHLTASVVFSLLFVLLRACVGMVQTGMEGQAVGLREIATPLLVKTWHFNAMIYWVILSVCHAMEFYRRYRDRQTRTLELERLLSEARLRALQMQLNPHFLFNTLNAVSTLMHRDVDAADRMIARLGGLLRRALESTETQEVTLEEELNFLSEYLEIEGIRFGDRMQVRMNIASDTKELLVPNLILQPLVENSIRHGIEGASGAGTIEIEARTEGTNLEIRVTNRCGDSSRSQPRSGVGLANVRSRLEQLYGSRHTFESGFAPSGEYVNQLRIPAIPSRNPQSSSKAAAS